MLLLNILGYHLGGVTGLGIAFVVYYFCYLIQVSVIARWRYGFKYSQKISLLFLKFFASSVLCLWVMLSYTDAFAIPTGALISAISVYFAYLELDRRIGIKNLLTRFRNR
jgi:hypothetical protein